MISEIYLSVYPIEIIQLIVALRSLYHLADHSFILSLSPPLLRAPLIGLAMHRHTRGPRSRIVKPIVGGTSLQEAAEKVLSLLQFPGQGEHTLDLPLALQSRGKVVMV